MENKVIRDVLFKIQSLPPLPSSVGRLFQLADDPNTDIRDITQTISGDQALTTKVLRVSNSAFYGLSHRVSTISQAVMILGFQGVKNLSLGISVFEFFHKNVPDVSFNREDFWRHSLGVACSSRILSPLFRIPNPEEAYTSGLIHDIGRAIFMEYFTEQYIELLKKAEVGEKSLISLEREAFGIDHAALGGKLCEHWKLPHIFIQAVADHHSSHPQKQPVLKGQDGHEGRMVNLIQVADNVAKIARVGASGDPHVKMDFMQLLAVEKVLPDHVFQLLVDLPTEIQKAEVFFDLVAKPLNVKETEDIPSNRVAVLLKNSVEEGFVSMVLQRLGYHVVTSLDINNEQALAGVIIDEVVSPTLQEFIYRSHLPVLNFAKWQNENKTTINHSVHLERLEAWLGETLASRIG